jgi:hypothetical protein
MSQARAEANRANAKRSTGPKTAAGKARASKNALRHGLGAAVPEAGDPKEVLDLAARLCGGSDLSVAARNAAETELHLSRIRTIKRGVLEAAIRRAQSEFLQDQSLKSDDVLARALAECADELLKLDGYERKARSRRKRAFRALFE